MNSLQHLIPCQPEEGFKNRLLFFQAIQWDNVYLTYRGIWTRRTQEANYMTLQSMASVEFMTSSWPGNSSFPHEMFDILKLIYSKQTLTEKVLTLLASYQSSTLLLKPLCHSLINTIELAPMHQPKKVKPLFQQPNPSSNHPILPSSCGRDPYVWKDT